MVVRDSPVLHPKVYLADRSLALVTSANLSEAGFSSNLGAAVVILEPEGIEEVTQLLAIRPSGTTARAEAFQIFCRRVFRPVDDAKIFATTAFHGRLNQPAPIFGDEIQRFRNHALAAASRQFLPPVDSFGFALGRFSLNSPDSFHGQRG